MVLLDVGQVPIFQRSLLFPTSAACSSEMLVPVYYTTQCYVPRDHNLHTYWNENLRSHICPKFDVLSLGTDACLSIVTVSTIFQTDYSQNMNYTIESGFPHCRFMHYGHYGSAGWLQVTCGQEKTTAWWEISICT